MNTARPKHIIIEGIPAAGKTEVSSILKLFYPGKIIYLPEITTMIVNRENLNIMRDREKLTDKIEEELPKRKEEIDILKKKLDPSAVILEESHIGVHWAYSVYLEDKMFIERYQKIKASILLPDKFIRLLIPYGLSASRQNARNTPGLEVDPLTIEKMHMLLIDWHEANNTASRVIELDADRAPEQVVYDISQLLGLIYEREKNEF